MDDAGTGPDPIEARGQDGPRRSPDAVAALRAVCTGPVHTPHGVDAFVELAGRRRDGLGRRLVVVGAVDAYDVVHALTWAAAYGAAVAVPGTGHVGTDDRPTVVVTRARIDTVVVDPVTALAHVGVGATWAAVRATAVGLGFAADVPDLPLPVADAHTAAFLGILEAAPVRALTVVTGDGVIRRVDPTSEPDLWWTLCRGSDRAGILIGIELAVDAAPRRRPAPAGASTRTTGRLPRRDAAWSSADRARLAAIARRYDPVGVLDVHAPGHA